MDAKSEIHDFLTSRRARLTPETVGLTSYGRRRVPGLRREEVAVLAGVSVPYYTRLERGDFAGVSDGVIEALARALELDDAERAHLWDLARAARPTDAPRRRRPRKPVVRPSVQRILDSMTEAAAFLHNARLDNLAANHVGRALYSDLFASASGSAVANNARYVFLHEGSRDFYVDWERAANDVVGILRSEAGRDPYDRDLSDLVGELSTQSHEFRTRCRDREACVGGQLHAVVGQGELADDRMMQLLDARVVQAHVDRGSRLQERGGACLAGQLGRHRTTASPSGRASGGAVTAETPVVMSAAADKHVPSILQELGLAATPTGHRRVLAALAYLRESRR